MTTNSIGQFMMAPIPRKKAIAKVLAGTPNDLYYERDTQLSNGDWHACYYHVTRDRFFDLGTDTQFYEMRRTDEQPTTD